MGAASALPNGTLHIAPFAQALLLSGTEKIRSVMPTERRRTPGKRRIPPKTAAARAPTWRQTRPPGRQSPVVTAAARAVLAPGVAPGAALGHCSPRAQARAPPLRQSRGAQPSHAPQGPAAPLHSVRLPCQQGHSMPWGSGQQSPSARTEVLAPLRQLGCGALPRCRLLPATAGKQHLAPGPGPCPGRGSCVLLRTLCATLQAAATPRRWPLQRHTEGRHSSTPGTLLQGRCGAAGAAPLLTCRSVARPALLPAAHFVTMRASGLTAGCLTMLA